VTFSLNKFLRMGLMQDESFDTKSNVESRTGMFLQNFGQYLNNVALWTKLWLAAVWTVIWLLVSVCKPSNGCLVRVLKVRSIWKKYTLDMKQLENSKKNKLEQGESNLSMALGVPSLPSHLTQSSRAMVLKFSLMSSFNKNHYIQIQIYMPRVSNTNRTYNF
jgi:hypothetical protein